MGTHIQDVNDKLNTQVDYSSSHTYVILVVICNAMYVECILMVHYF